jgi:hypothetical protein
MRSLQTRHPPPLFDVQTMGIACAQGFRCLLWVRYQSEPLPSPGISKTLAGFVKAQSAVFCSAVSRKLDFDRHQAHEVANFDKARDMSRS